MPKTIKLSEEVVATFARFTNLKNSIVSLLAIIGKEESNVWKSIRKRFPKLNFTSASIDHDTGTLTLPFEEDEEELDQIDLFSNEKIESDE